MLDLLQHDRRRLVLDELFDADSAVPVYGLAESVARREATDGTGASAGDVDQVRLSLSYCHLPKLSTAEVVWFDADKGVAALVGDADRVTRFVELSEAIVDIILES